MNCEYGWVKFTTKRERHGDVFRYTSRLTDHPTITHTSDTPELALGACFAELAQRIREGRA